ncbi:TasA family protein [Thermococcus eurythermalis]|nr:TasA family protein [Thermococcus eurythermalis]
MSAVNMKHLAIVSAILAMLALSGVARSYFTDTALSEGNTITTGELDVAISKDGKRFYNELKLFEVENLLPGENRTVTFYVKNRGTVDMGRLTLTLNVRNYEVKMSPAEKEVDSTPEEGELGKWLTLRAITVNGRKIKVNETLNSLSGKAITLPQMLKPDESAQVEMTFELPKEAGNECQTDGVKLTIRVDAGQ